MSGTRHCPDRVTVEKLLAVNAIILESQNRLIPFKGHTENKRALNASSCFGDFGRDQYHSTLSSPFSFGTNPTDNDYKYLKSTDNDYQYLKLSHIVFSPAQTNTTQPSPFGRDQYHSTLSSSTSTLKFQYSTTVEGVDFKSLFKSVPNLFNDALPTVEYFDLKPTLLKYSMLQENMCLPMLQEWEKVLIQVRDEFEKIETMTKDQVGGAIFSLFGVPKGSKEVYFTKKDPKFFLSFEISCYNLDPNSIILRNFCALLKSCFDVQPPLDTPLRCPTASTKRKVRKGKKLDLDLQ